MAKYKLQKSNNVVSCEVLNESDGQYVVRFGNGVIQSVPKNRVYQLDRIDEGVLDTVRGAVNKYGRKIASRVKDIAQRIKDFIVNVFVVDDFVLLSSTDNQMIPASHPVNCIAGSKMTDSVNFYPGNDVVDTCNELGVDDSPVENYQFIGKFDEPIQFVNYSYLLESCGSSLLQRINEAEKDRFSATGEGISLKGTFCDWNAEQISDSIYEEWKARVAGTKPNTLPLLIWGAPGIGKTSIIRALSEKIKNDYGSHISVCSVNGGNIGPDDFTMPASISETLRKNNLDDFGQQDDFVGATRVYIKDLPKSWLPVYDAKRTNDNNPELGNAVANGGGIIKDRDGNDVIQNGPGGIFIIDEYSRLSQAGMAALMMTPTTREIGSNSTLRFGDRWVIVCLANRKSDMSVSGNKKVALSWEAASKTRFNHVNFVPDPLTILEFFRVQCKIKESRKDDEFATLSIKDAIGNIEQEVGTVGNYVGEDFVDPIIYHYLKTDYETHPGDWGDLYEMWDHKGGDLNGTKATACPRTWEALGWVLYNKIRFGKDGYTSVVDIPRNELIRLASGIVGKDVAMRFATFVGLNSNFTQKDAQNVWKKGVDAKYDVLSHIDSANSERLMLNHIMPTLETCAPDLYKYPDAVLNFFKFLNLYCDSDAASGFNGNLFKKAFSQFQTEFNVNLSGQADEDVFADVLDFVYNVFDDHNLGSN